MKTYRNTPIYNQYERERATKVLRGVRKNASRRTADVSILTVTQTHNPPLRRHLKLYQSINHKTRRHHPGNSKVIGRRSRTNEIPPQEANVYLTGIIFATATAPPIGGTYRTSNTDSTNDTANNSSLQTPYQNTIPEDPNHHDLRPRRRHTSSLKYSITPELPSRHRSRYNSPSIPSLQNPTRVL